MATSATTRARILFAVAPLALLFALVLVVGLKTKAREDGLRRHGVVTQALVLGHATRGDTDYLWVHLDCGCRVAVATSNGSAHPVGSTLPVRYDLRRPARAEALVDAPNPYEAVLVFGFGIIFAIVIGVPLVLVAVRRTRRARALVDSSVPTARVRVEAWERSFLNQVVPYLSVYPAELPPGGRPLLSLPVTPQTLDELRAGDVFDLFGTGERGQALALRRGELTILPAGKTQDATWEHRHRDPQATIAIAGTAGDTFPPGRLAGAAGTDSGRIFADAAEARAYRRATARLRWLFAGLLPIALFRFVPESILRPALVLVFAYLGALVLATWRQRRLLARLARRLPGGPPVGRRARRAAARAAQRRVSTLEGMAELAELLGTTSEGLQASDRRFLRLFYGSTAVTAALVVMVIVRVAVS